MNVNEVQKYLKETYGEDIVADFGDGIFHRNLGEYSPKSFTEITDEKGYSWDIGSGVEDDRYSFIIVDGYGGEGDGVSFWGVAKITDKQTNEEIFVKVEGYYASYVGAECDDPTDWREVKPVTETRIVYK